MAAANGATNRVVVLDRSPGNPGIGLRLGDAVTKLDGVRVIGVRAGSLSDGKLTTNDNIISINGESVLGCTHQEAAEKLVASDRVELGVKRLGTSSLDELDAPLDTAGRKIQLTYDGKYRYLDYLVEQQWKRCKGVRIDYVKAACVDQGLMCSADVKAWKAGDNIVVWDLFYDNHQAVAIFIPGAGLHVLDPVVGSPQRARTHLLELVQSNEGRSIGIKTARCLPASVKDVGRSADPAGVCMLWCCYFITVMMLGLDWDAVVASPIERIEAGMERSKYLPRTISIALVDIPAYIIQFLPDDYRWSDFKWMKRGIPIRPGHYKDLYNNAGTGDGYTRRIEVAHSDFFWKWRHRGIVPYKEIIDDDISILGHVATEGMGYVAIEPVPPEAVPAGAAQSVAGLTTSKK